MLKSYYKIARIVKALRKNHFDKHTPFVMYISATMKGFLIRQENDFIVIKEVIIANWIKENKHAKN